MRVRRVRLLSSLTLSAAAAALAGCGGGGSAPPAPGGPSAGAPSPAPASPVTGTPVVGAPAPAPAPGPAAPPAPVVFTGTAATGAALEGAIVKVLDARGREVGRSTAVGADGKYSVTVEPDAQAPLAFVAELDGKPEHVSIHERAESANVNITPLTSLVATRLSTNGTPAGLLRDFTGGTPPPVDTIRAKVDEVVATIAPVAQALGDTTHPITGSFNVGGVGHDKLLDSIDVVIVPATTTSSNVEVTVRTKRTEDRPMPSISFASGDATVPSLPAVQRSDLGADGTSARIDALVRRANECLAQPLDVRVDSGVSPVVLKPGVCRDMFWQSDPTLYLHNGWRPGPGRAFNGFHTATGNNGVWSRPVFEYTRDNGDVVFSFQWRTQDGAIGSETMVARQDLAGDLRVIGNQFAYPMSVRPIVWDHQHLLWPQVDFRSTGYNILVDNLLDGGGQPVFDRVVVTSPARFSGSIPQASFTLRPVAGTPHLRHVRPGGGQTDSSVVQLAGFYWTERTAAPLHPSEHNAQNFLWAAPQTWTDGALESIPHKGVWTFEYFLAGNTGSTPDAVQSMTTISRAPSMREARLMTLAAFTPSTIELLTEGSRQWGNFDVTAHVASLPSPATAEFTLNWTVPDDASVLPTRANISGRSGFGPWSSRPRFMTGTSFLSTARSASIVCPVSILSGVHCTTDVPARWVPNSRLTWFELWGRDARQVEATKAYIPYKPDSRL